MKKRRRDRGFTLVEMMVVIVIIGILATVIIVNISGKGDRAKAQITETNIKTLANEVELFKLEHGRFPDKLMDLVEMPSFADPKKWPPGGYVPEIPLDGWGNPFVYTVTPGTGVPFEIVSLGGDGQPGGQGFDADISNRKRRQ
jgi:general secretion pathway protein G